MNEPRYLLDTGPLAAFFDPRDQYHAWATQIIRNIEAPLTTCEPVLTEAFYLLGKTHNGIQLLGEFCESGSLAIDFHVLDNTKAVLELLHKYGDVPMSLADACLVLLAEKHPNGTLVTTDRDFLIYRTRNRRQIRLQAPFLE